MSEAIVVLPAAAFGRIGDPRLRQWLSRGVVTLEDPPAGPLPRIVMELQATPAGDAGSAASRYLGQTGERPAGWVAGADPVFLRPRMRDIVVDVLPPDVVPAPDLVALIASLNAGFADVAGIRFESIGPMGYLFGDTPVATSTVETRCVHGRVPATIGPSGGSVEHYQRINTEIQMLLHEHPVNLRRQARDMPPINALWLWGGGRALTSCHSPLPPLFAEDPVFRGYWLTQGVQPLAWPGDIAACAEASKGSFVAVPPEGDARSPDPWLHELRALMSGGRLRRLSMHSRDGLCVKLRGRDRFRLWRRVAGELQERNHSE